MAIDRYAQAGEREQTEAPEDARIVAAGRGASRKKLRHIIETDTEPQVLHGSQANSLFESLRMFEMPYATVAAATDKGVHYKPYNEDRIALNAEANFAAVIDGMGGGNKGYEAADIIARALANHPTQIPAAIRTAKEGMAHLRGEEGAVFISGRILLKKNRRRTLYVDQAGDARLFVVDREGSISFCSTDESETQAKVDHNIITADQALYDKDRHYVKNSIRPHEGESKPYGPVRLTIGDRVYICSDGIGDNLTPEEIAAIGKDRGPEKTIEMISDITSRRMHYCVSIGMEIKNGERQSKGIFSDGYLSLPKRDNRAIVIMDVR